MTDLGPIYYFGLLARPCQRCVKRDLAATCADGVRKKAKYLQDAYDSQQQSDQGSQPPQGNMLGGMPDHLSADQDPMQRHNSMEGIDNTLCPEKRVVVRIVRTGC